MPESTPCSGHAPTDENEGFAAMKIYSLLLPVLLAGLSCARQVPEQLAVWPLPCSSFPGGEETADCARRDASGDIVLRPGVVGSAEFPDVVLVGGELTFALASGKSAPALFFDNGPDPFVEGLARTIRSGRVGFVNEALDLVVPRDWDFAFPFEGGFARVCTGCSIVREEGDEHGSVVGGAWGVIDREGRVVVPVEFSRESLPEPMPDPP
jgi:hypothetical protein